MEPDGITMSADFMPCFRVKSWTTPVRWSAIFVQARYAPGAVALRRPYG